MTIASPGASTVPIRTTVAKIYELHSFFEWLHATPDKTSLVSRCADGVDTDDNGANFQLVGITPGSANACPSGPTPAPTTKPSTPAPAQRE